LRARAGLGRCPGAGAFAAILRNDHQPHARRGAQIQTLDAEAGGGAGAGDEDHIDRCLRQGGRHRHGVHAGVVEGLAGRVGRPIGNRFQLRRHVLRAIALRHIEAVAEDHLRGVQLGTGESVVAGIRAATSTWPEGSSVAVWA
jgi:hypothetical protein